MHCSRVALSMVGCGLVGWDGDAFFADEGSSKIQGQRLSLFAGDLLSFCIGVDTQALASRNRDAHRYIAPLSGISTNETDLA